MECKKEVTLPAIFAALACSRRIQRDWGHLLVNFVFTELRRSYDMIEYYRTEGGQEVDFLVTDRQGRRSLFQVTADLQDPATRKRELKALNDAMQECRLRKGAVITLNEEE